MLDSCTFRMNSTLTGDPIKQAIFTCHCRKLTRYRSIRLTTHMYDQIDPLLGIYKECIRRRLNTRKPSLAKPETLSPPPRERGLAPRMATRGEGRVVELWCSILSFVHQVCTLCEADINHVQFQLTTSNSCKLQPISSSCVWDRIADTAMAHYFLLSAAYLGFLVSTPEWKLPTVMCRVPALSTLVASADARGVLSIVPRSSTP